MCALEYRYDVDGAGHVNELFGETWARTGEMLLDGIRRTTWLGPFSPCERDLLRVMAAVLDIDRLSPRRPARGSRLERDLSWQRTLSVRIAVEDRARWTRAEASLRHLMHFMTDDSWEVNFSDSPRPKVQQLLPRAELERVDEVALFSGGLDSVAGLYARSLAKRRGFVVVSACGNEVRSRAQAAALNELRALGVKATWLKLAHQLRATHRGRPQMEASQRSRGLLFLAMGAVAASRLAKPSCSIYETGVGCINMSMCGAQVSTQGTRAMHPRTLLLFNELLRSVLDEPVRMIAPFFLSTKGELCRATGPALARLASKAVSCDEGEGHKPDPMQHCGVCTSCLFRRIAIFSAAQLDPTKYRDRIKRQHGRYEQLVFESHARQLRACTTFADLLAIDPNVRFAATLPVEAPASTGEAEVHVLDMYRRYAIEIMNFLERGRPTLAPRPRPPHKENERDLFAAVR